MTIGEVLALVLAAGPAKFLAGPLTLLIEIVGSCDLIMFYNYMILAQGQLRSLTRWSHVLYVKDQQDYSAQLERLRASMQHWLYSTLIYVEDCSLVPLHESNRQLLWETAGFPMPQQLADLTLAEVEGFIPAMVSVLAPIFGAIGVARYPTKPITRTVCVHPVSKCTYLQGSPVLTYPLVLDMSHEWGNAPSLHYHQNREAAGRIFIGCFASPYTKS